MSVEREGGWISSRSFLRHDVDSKGPESEMGAASAKDVMIP